MVDIGQKVRLRFTGTLDDGTEFDSSARRGEPFELVVGSKTMLSRFEKAVNEMEIGEKRIVRIPADEAYGVYDEDLIQTVPMDSLPGAGRLHDGDIVVLSSPAGPLTVKVVEVGDQSVTLDFNHELAGKDLTFSLELVSIVRESAIECERHPAGCACGCDRLKQSLAS
ncbi:FKBP-type peptidyl-prolyl cis-trans isomerase [Gordonibacter massiliensis (ex Traore et al. 2017)]|uniref:FKBP-type peptidyl-prolyl cis-trans isomerase n=1 Tax=Gordonibacter massiliensis (ex Traore et al. 2017) TaxID=1841863 RepID=UPI001C8BD0AF|nr:peptidylprolyl isomerase [Gordonibacter massiliensis (ex Traore et al. 2017)]